MAELLVNECGASLSYARILDAEGIERVQFAVLKISGGLLDRLWLAVDQAQQDWRDTLMGAEFGYDERAHLSWLSEDTKPDIAAEG